MSLALVSFLMSRLQLHRVLLCRLTTMSLSSRNSRYIICLNSLGNLRIPRGSCGSLLCPGTWSAENNSFGAAAKAVLLITGCGSDNCSVCMRPSFSFPVSPSALSSVRVLDAFIPFALRKMAQGKVRPAKTAVPVLERRLRNFPPICINKTISRDAYTAT